MGNCQSQSQGERFALEITLGEVAFERLVDALVCPVTPDLQPADYSAKAIFQACNELEVTRKCNQQIMERGSNFDIGDCIVTESCALAKLPASPQFLILVVVPHSAEQLKRIYTQILKTAFQLRDFNSICLSPIYSKNAYLAVDVFNEFFNQHTNIHRKTINLKVTHDQFQTLQHVK